MGRADMAVPADVRPPYRVRSMRQAGAGAAERSQAASGVVFAKVCGGAEFGPASGPQADLLVPHPVFLVEETPQLWFEVGTKAPADKDRAESRSVLGELGECLPHVLGELVDAALVEGVFGVSRRWDDREARATGGRLA